MQKFYWPAENFSQRHQMLCGNFYTSKISSFFHTASVLTLGDSEAKDQDVIKELESLDPKYFHEGRGGDDLHIPFECDLYISIKS